MARDGDPVGASTTTRHRRDGVPERNTEYLLYQTLVGAWPIGADRGLRLSGQGDEEAKVHTSWTDPGRRRTTPPWMPSSRAVLADAWFRRRPRTVPRRTSCGGTWSPQLARADRIAAHLPGRSRPIPGQRALGSQPRRPGQPSPGRLRRAAARRWTRAATSTPTKARHDADSGTPKLWLIAAPAPAPTRGRA